MKTALLFAAVLALAACTAIPEHKENYKKEAKKELLTGQRDILQLLPSIHKPNPVKEQADIRNTYDIEGNINNDKTAYNPELGYQKGVEMPLRSSNAQGSNGDFIFRTSEIVDYLNRIVVALNDGYGFDGYDKIPIPMIVQEVIELTH